jgi:S1-C subfamily serine protease
VLDTAAATLGLLLVLAAAAACGAEPVPLTASAYRLDVESCGGTVGQRASAAAIAADLVATVAHPFDGAARFELRDAAGVEVEATLVHLDPARDVALLRLAEPAPHHLEPLAPEGPGPVTIVSYAEPDGPTTEDGRILELVDATLDGTGRRAAARLAADIDPGDSGAAVVDPDGRLVAMAFATVRDTEQGWAISANELLAAAESPNAAGPGGALPAC